jgi:hypothetical protein
MEKLWNNRDEVSLWRKRLSYEKRDGKERLVRLRDGEIMKEERWSFSMEKEIKLWKKRNEKERLVRWRDREI